MVKNKVLKYLKENSFCPLSKKILIYEPPFTFKTGAMIENVYQRTQGDTSNDRHRRRLRRAKIIKVSEGCRFAKEGMEIGYVFNYHTSTRLGKMLNIRTLIEEGKLEEASEEEELSCHLIINESDIEGIFTE